MNLFVFGLGYSACYFRRRFATMFETAVGTVRQASKAAAIAENGLRPVIFGGQSISDELIGLLRDAEVVIDSIPPFEGSEFIMSRVRTVLAATRVPKHIIYLSTVGVYGDRGGGWVDETSPLIPGNERSQRRLAAETAWLDWGKEGVARISILRLAGIYGPGQNALVNLRSGTAKRIIKPGQIFNRIHVEDIARTIAAAITLGFNGIVNVSDDAPSPPQDVIAFAAELLQLPLPPAIPFDGADLSPMARSFYAENKRVSNARMRHELAVRLAYPSYREGLQALFLTGDGARLSLSG
jgi:nucleoside-diphosphate-sugar epimerase